VANREDGFMVGRATVSLRLQRLLLLPLVSDGQFGRFIIGEHVALDALEEVLMQCYTLLLQLH
jgi:hypothetical protein